MRRIIQKILATLARKIIIQYRPTIIGITGSVGKTSTREAVFAVVTQKFRARQSEKNFNNEFGLPFTVIGIQSPGRNTFKWLSGILKGLRLLIIKQRYPRVLVLEMGIDRPGDMDYLLSIARPDIAIITNIGISHFEFFKEAALYEQEKGKLAESLTASGTLIVNADNAKALAQKSKTAARVLTYGMRNVADVFVTDQRENLQAPYGTAFSVKTPTRTFQAQIRALGDPHVSSMAAAIAVAEVLGIETDLLMRGIQEYKPTPGRLNVIAGIKKTVVIDDTYNAAPESDKIALELLAKFPGGRKIAILGDMLELGSLSDQSHREIGIVAAKSGLSELITVGPVGKLIADGARGAGFDPAHIFSFDTSLQAIPQVQNLLASGIVILIKGSQGMRMEKITKEIMAEPMRAGELLCRQYGKWLTT